MRRLHLIAEGSCAPCGALLSDGHAHEPPRNWAVRSAFAGDPPAGATWCPDCQAHIRAEARIAAGRGR